jgi:hypothetical protein
MFTPDSIGNCFALDFIFIFRWHREYSKGSWRNRTIERLSLGREPVPEAGRCNRRLTQCKTNRLLSYTCDLISNGWILSKRFAKLAPNRM